MKLYICQRSVIVVMFLFFFWTMIPDDALYSQELIILKGRILNTADKRPVSQAVVFIAETRAFVRTKENGEYRFMLTGKGQYTVTVKAVGFRPLETRLALSGGRDMDFWLKPLSQAGGITIVGQRDIQKVSRQTLTARELKDVPASLGDSINALTALPGIIRTAGFFGNLVIRGAPDSSNRYYIDNMPLYNPLHFGGLHSVIANELMSEIDLYASAFPAEYGGPTAAVISINTMDDVQEFGGYADIGLISATALVKIPLYKTVLKDENYEKENKGYVIVSGRYGYLTLFVPLFYDLILGQDVELVPEYWDYQVKAKYNFDAKHSLTLLAIGSRDYFRVASEEKPKAGDDPVLDNFRFATDIMSFTQGLTYNYRHSKMFSNELLFYASLTESTTSTELNNDAAAAWTNYYNASKPYIYGLKDTLRFKWLDDRAELRLGFDVTIYNFICSGYNFVPNETAGGIPDFSNENAFALVPVKPVLNVVVGGFFDNKFTYKGLTVVPGVRLDYLDRNNSFVADPRLLISYEFKSETTLSLAGGMYSSFYQVNPYIFQYAQYIAAIGEDLRPERAAHSVLGLEQKVFLFTIRAEGFFNYFWDMGVSGYYLDNYFENKGDLMAYGAEFMIRLDRTERAAGFFGWINYTFTQSKFRSGLPDVYDTSGNKIISGGDKYVNFDYEQEHALKIVLGYTYKQHTISGKFQLYTSFPYTPITGGVESPAEGEPGYDENNKRYYPTYYGAEVNSEHFPIDHRLDIRYTYTSNHEWGHVSWYIEIINIYNNVALNSENWRYDQPYSKGHNPTLEKDPAAFSLIPNFGVEIKF